MNPINKLREIITGGMHAYAIVKEVAHRVKRLEYAGKRDALIKDILENNMGGGTSKEPLCDHEVIVSLTTYGKRLYDVAVTIESIMQGTVKPNRIILWLGEDMKSLPIPVTLQKQLERGLEIEYCKDTRSYKKLIPCLKKYPEACIITIDDDLIYDYDLVENTISWHKQYPQDIIANRIHQMILDKNGKPITYWKWKWCYETYDVTPLNFLTGAGGVLYPPHCFDDEVFNEEVFLDICKFADDVWFNAMALKKGTKVRNAVTGHSFIENPDLQAGGLAQINVYGGRCRNDEQLEAVYTKYDLYKKLK